MDQINDFINENWVIVLVVALLILFSILGYYVDKQNLLNLKKNKKQQKKSNETNKIEQEPNNNYIENENLTNDVEMQLEIEEKEPEEINEILFDENIEIQENSNNNENLESIMDIDTGFEDIYNLNDKKDFDLNEYQNDNNQEKIEDISENKESNENFDIVDTINQIDQGNDSSEFETMIEIPEEQYNEPEEKKYEEVESDENLNKTMIENKQEDDIFLKNSENNSEKTLIEQLKEVDIPSMDSLDDINQKIDDDLLDDVWKF